MSLGVQGHTVSGMRYGVSIPPFTDSATVLALTREAEEAGWDGVFLWDHIQWSVGMETHDPFVLLGAMARETERVRLGTMVTPVSRRRPWVVAKQMTTLDHLSAGRAVLGVGLGDPQDLDFSDMGDVADPRARAQLLDESLDVIDQLWRGPTQHTGEHYAVAGDFLPRPVQRPRPSVWVAGVLPNRRPLRRARRWDGVVPLAEGGTITPEQLVDYLARVPAEEERVEPWDVVAGWAEGVPAQEYADAGTTWLIASTRPDEDGWVESLRRTISTAR